LGSFCIVASFFLFFILVGVFSNRAQQQAIASLLDAGVPARGILLQVNSRGQRVGPRTVAGGLVQGYEQRAVSIDVEVPGKPPYVVNGPLMIPLNLVRDVLPGATVELRVDPTNPQKIAVVGPGVGFAFQPPIAHAVVQPPGVTVRKVS
jgi:hypothetical protein